MKRSKVALIFLVLSLIAIGAALVYLVLRYQANSNTNTNVQYTNPLSQCQFDSIKTSVSANPQVTCKADSSGKSCPPCDYPSSAYCYVVVQNSPNGKASYSDGTAVPDGYWCGCARPGCNFNTVSNAYVCNGSETTLEGWKFS